MVLLLTGKEGRSGKAILAVTSETVAFESQDEPISPFEARHASDRTLIPVFLHQGESKGGASPAALGVDLFLHWSAL